MNGVAAAGPRVELKPIKPEEDGVAAIAKKAVFAQGGLGPASFQVTGPMDQTWVDELIKARGQGGGMENLAAYAYSLGGQPGYARTYLESLLVNGGSPHLQSFLEYRHLMNVQMVEEMAQEAEAAGTPMTEPEKLVAIANLDDIVALDVMGEMAQTQANGVPLGSEAVQTGSHYLGIDLIRDVEYEGELSTDEFNALLNPMHIQDMTDEEVSAAVSDLLGPAGGGAAMSAARAQASASGTLGQFDRGFLISLGTTYLTARDNPQFATNIGIDAKMKEDAAKAAEENEGSSEIPLEHQKSLLHMIAYVFAKMDAEMDKVIKDSVKSYWAQNEQLGNTKSDSGQYDQEVANNVSYAQMKLKADMELKSGNISMGTSLLNTAAETAKRLWS